MNSLLSIKNLYSGYKGNQVLQGINLEVPKGSIFGYLGKNGAGKSTTIKVLLGLIPIEKGDICFRGVNLKENPLVLRSHSSSMIESPFFYPFLSVSENLNYLNSLFKMGQKRKREVLSLMGLNNFIDKKAQTLSSGLKQRLGLAMCLFSRPEMLILDEPLNALDPQGIYELRMILKKLNEEEGVTIFLSSHILEELEKLADYVAVIHNGNIRYQGELSRLIQKQVDIVSFKVSDTAIIKQLAYDAKFSLLKVYDQNNVDFEVANEAEFAQLIATLIKNGLSVYNVTHRGSALENAFIHLTK